MEASISGDVLGVVEERSGAENGSNEGNEAQTND